MQSNKNDANTPTLTQEQATRVPETSLLFRNNPAGFCWLLLILLAALLSLPFIMIRSGLDSYLSANPPSAKLDYLFDKSTPSAEILLWGDSTCMQGIDARIVSQQLHTSVLNLCEPVPVLNITGQYGLDRYLATHKKPSLIVLILSPSNSSLPSAMQKKGVYDNWYVTVKYGGPRLFLQTLRRDPFLLFSFAATAFHNEFLGSFMAPRRYPSFHREITQSRGLMLTSEKLSPVSSCLPYSSEDTSSVLAHTYINQFVKTYSTKNYRTAIFFTPVADCNPNLREFKTYLKGIAIDEPYSIPRTLIADERIGPLRSQFHPFPKAVPAMSRDLADAISRAFPNQ